LLGNAEVKPLLAGLSATVFRTHDFNPRFACLSRLLKDLGGHLESLKLLKLQHKVALKRLASAVQLRPWPPSFQSLASRLPVTSSQLVTIQFICSARWSP